MPPKPRRLARIGRFSAVTLWLIGWLVASAAAATTLIDTPLPDLVATLGGLALPVLFAVGVSHRSGGRVWIWGPLTAAAAVGTYYLDEPWMWSTMAVVAAVAGAILSVLATRPAPTLSRTLVEFGVTLVVAGSAALAVAAMDASVSSARFNLVVLGLALVGAIALVWQLGAGLHGLGARGLLLIVGGALALTVVLIYGMVLRRYGSQSVIEGIDEAVTWMSDHLRGVPRPVEVLVGFPALVWGVSTRAARRQGWWMTAFGVLGSATIATSLAAPAVEPVDVAISTGYSVLLGGLLGLAIRKIDQMLTGGGSRARRATDQVPLRPEPGRTSALR